MFGLSDYMSAATGPVDSRYPSVWAAHYNDGLLGTATGAKMDHVFDVLLPFAYSLEVQTSVLILNDHLGRSLFHTVIQARDPKAIYVMPEVVARYSINDRGVMVITESIEQRWTHLSPAGKAVRVIGDRRIQGPNPEWSFVDALGVATSWRP